MNAIKDTMPDQVIEDQPTLEERVDRIRAIQKRTAHRNDRLRAGLWNTEEDDTLDVNVLLPMKDI